MRAEPRYTFSIQLPISLHQKLLNKVGKGKVSVFIKEILEKELTEEEDKLANEYRECYSNPRMIKEAKQWEQAEIESWRNFEESKKEKAKK